MHLPDFMRRVNRVFTNPLLGTIAWLVYPMAVIHHRGRKSGRPYRSPVIAFPTRRGWVIPMTYGQDVDWAKNLVAAGGGEIVQSGTRHRLVKPRIVGNDEGGPRLPWLPRLFLVPARLPGYVLTEP